MNLAKAVEACGGRWLPRLRTGFLRILDRPGRCPGAPKAACLIGALMLALPGTIAAQGDFAPTGGEYGIGGALPGEQVYPQASVRPSGGYVAWQDNITDGAGLGVSARKLDGTFSGVLSAFRVNQQGALDQERPAVTMLNDGGAAFVWQGGRQSYQHIYARFLSAGGTWVTGDLMVSTSTNVFQTEAATSTMINGNVAVVWSSFNQVSSNSLRDVYLQLLTPAGAKIGGEVLVNQATAYNQRTAAVTPLSDGRFAVVWISEQQRFENSVDVMGRIYSETGAPLTGEFFINNNTNVCANPVLAPTSDGGFGVGWMEKDLVTRSNSWDIYVRTFNSAAAGGTVRRVNTRVHGEQFGPKLAAAGTDFLVAWTSMAQDGSREGIYGQFLRSDGTPFGGEFRINATTISQQMHPAVASDGVGQFLAVWTSYTGGSSTFDLRAQRYYNTATALVALGAPIVSVLSSNALSVTWPPVQGLPVAHYEVYADGAANATATVTNAHWTATGLAPASSHGYRLAYVLTDGRRSPLSGTTSNTTYSAGATWGGIPQEWMMAYFGNDLFAWPSPYADTDGDGASNRDEFLAGTDPTDATSVLRMRLQHTSQGLFLTWNTEPGLMYQVQSSANLGTWQRLGGPRFAAGYLDSMYVGGGQFGIFRIERLR